MLPGIEGVFVTPSNAEKSGQNRKFDSGENLQKFEHKKAEKRQELPPKKGVVTCENLCLKVAESDISEPLKRRQVGLLIFEETGRIGNPKKWEPEKT